MMITKNTLLAEIVENCPQVDSVFMAYGIGGIGSVSAFFNTVGESAVANGIDPDTFVSILNQKTGAERYAVL